MEQENKTYEIEDILEMLGGYDYFDYEQIQYIYHKLNNEEDEAKYYLDVCNKKAEKLKKMVNKIDDKVKKAQLENKIESLEKTDIND